MNNYNELISLAQSDLKDFGQLSPKIAQELIDALIELTTEKGEEE